MGNKRKDIQRGTPLWPDEPATLPRLFQMAANKHNRADALSYKKDGKWHQISSGEMIRRIENIALGLYALGLRKGDKAAIFAANSPEWTFADAGCQFAGVIDVPIYTTLAESAVCYISNDSGSRVFFIENKETFDRLDGIIPDCKTIETFVFFDGSGIEMDNAITLADLEARGEKLGAEKPGLIEDLVSAIEPTDLATLIYTSGTTGEPKGVMLSHTNLISNIIDAGEKYSFSEKDIPLSVLPLSHVFERNGMYLYILHGMAVHYAQSIDKVPDNLKEVRPTIFVGVPRIFEKVYSKAKLKAAESGGLKEKMFDWAIDIAKEVALRNEEDRKISFFLGVKHSLADKLVYSKLRAFFGGRLRFCITGGAALSDEIFLIFTGAGIRIMQGYGLTETSPVISSNNPIDTRLGTVGKPINNVKVRIAEDGEIEASGPGIMQGYYNKEEATHEAFTEDGWFRTGDIGKIDADGFITITDRKKELFKTSGGKYIAPSPIEQMIKGSRFVNQVVLVGNERKFASALIVPNFELLESYSKLKNLGLNSHTEMCQSPTIIDLLERQVAGLTEGLARFETVKKIAILENELTVEGGELTPTLKVKRRVVDEKYKDVIEKLYAEEE